MDLEFLFMNIFVGGCFDQIIWLFHFTKDYGDRHYGPKGHFGIKWLFGLVKKVP